MTLEELTFTAFQQGREQGREERAEEIERLTHQNEGFQHDAAAYREIKVEYEILLARSQREAAEIERLREEIKDLIDELAYHGVYQKTRAALQPKEDDQ